MNDYTREEIATYRALVDAWFDSEIAYSRHEDVLLDLMKETGQDYTRALQMLRAEKNYVLAELDVRIETHPYHADVEFGPSTLVH